MISSSGTPLRKGWLELAEVSPGPLFRKANRGGAVGSARLNAEARAAVPGLKGTLAEPVSPHGLRAEFVKTVYRDASGSLRA